MTLLETFRWLSSLAPSPNASKVPWSDYVDWAIAQGVAPLAAYNLEYRLAGGGAPDWARDRLLSVYQGSVNDNVMKLVGLKRALDALEGRRVVLVGAASFAEALYPHVAFRPVPEVQLLVRQSDAEGLAGYLKGFGFEARREKAGFVLSDQRTEVQLRWSLFGDAPPAEQEALLERALPVPVFGPSVHRLDLEDALLASCAQQAQAGYEVPAITFVDLRELLLGAPHMGGGAYQRRCEPGLLQERARALGVERALYCSLSVLARLFPEVEPMVREASPELNLAARTLLDGLVVGPLAEVGGVFTVRGAQTLRRLLVGQA